jgi:hypothetical protein
VLNEIELIKSSLAGLQKLPIDEIVVVDGGSTDGTWEYLLSLNRIRLISIAQGGLLRQRLSGIVEARNEVILLVDVDDQISKSAYHSAFQDLTREPKLDGVQLTYTSPNQNYWERGWSAYWEVIARPGQEVKLLGRPSLAYRSAFLQLKPPSENIFGEDTWIHLQEKDLARRYRVSTGASTRICPNTFRENVNQFSRYGITDASVGASTRSSRSLLFHTAIRIGIFRSCIALVRGSGRYVPFFILMSIIRTGAHLLSVLKNTSR